MNDESASQAMADAQADQSGQTTGSAGALLRAAREAAGLHVGALAVNMKVPVNKLEALEADRWDLLPDLVFTRALASSVCRTLKVDPAMVLSKMPQQATPRLDTEARSINTTFEMPEYRASRQLSVVLKKPSVILVALLLLGALLVVLVPEVHVSRVVVTPVAEPAIMAPAPEVAPDAALRAAPGASDPVAAVPASPAPAVAASDVASAVPGAGTAVATAPAPQASAVLAARAAASAPAAHASTAGPASAALAAASTASAARTPAVSAVVAFGQGLVGIRATHPTWVEITDARKLVLIRRTLTAGEAVGVVGDVPLQVVIGRADGVEVQTHGKPFDLGPFSTTNVARFEVK